MTNAGHRPGRHRAPGEPPHAAVALYPILPISTFGTGAVHTVGHSSRSLEALVAPLREAGMGYVWLGESLGGRVAETVPADQSPNGAWREPAFRHYADAMETPDFREGHALNEWARVEGGRLTYPALL